MTGPRRDERGITLILFTLMLTVLLVFVALAMDSGLVFNERRQDQSAIDAAVLAAAQLLLDDRTTANPDLAAAKRAAEKEILDVTYENTQSTNEIPLAQRAAWDAKWADCKATVPTGYVRSGTSECIAFLDGAGPQDPTRVWARLPDMRVGSTFGGVVGIDEYKTTADATAEIFMGDPYAVFAAATECDGVPPVEQVVDIGSELAPRPIVIDGPMHSNGKLEVQWDEATVTGFVSYVNAPPLPPTRINSGPSGVRTDPLEGISINDYASGPKVDQARASGVYFPFVGPGPPVTNQSLKNVGAMGPSGILTNNALIYSTRRVDLTPPVSGRATFVSTEQIAFRGNGFNVHARNGDLLAFSAAGGGSCGGDAGEAIRFEGSDNTWTGVVYAPNGTIRSCSAPGLPDCVTSDDPPLTTTFDGGLIGWIVDLDGPALRITNHGSLGFPAKVRLFR